MVAGGDVLLRVKRAAELSGRGNDRGICPGGLGGISGSRS